METRRQYGLFCDFTGPAQTHTAQTIPADLDAGADLAATAVFAPGVPHQLKDVYITGQTNSAGIDNSNTSVWVVSDSVGERFNSTFNAATTFPVELTPTALTEVTNTTGSVLGSGAATGYATLAITNGAAANTPVTVVSFEYYDYNAYPNPDWKVIATDNGYASISGVRGEMTLAASDVGSVADNDEIYFASNIAVFKYLDGKPIAFETRITPAEANTDDANVMVGLMDAVGADSLLDDGGGPKASYSGAVIYKVDGGTAWVCETSNGTAQTTNTSDKTVVADTATTLRIQLQPTTATNYVATFFIDEEQLKDATCNQFIQQNVSLTSAAAMQAVIGLKNGSANAETLVVDYVGVEELR
jgi:hypothetical protein